MSATATMQNQATLHHAAAIEAGMQPGERQVAPTIAGIRADHVARYEWARQQMAMGESVVDIGCGIGYGAKLLAEGGRSVVAMDADEAAIAYARQHYAHSGVYYACTNAEEFAGFIPGAVRHATCFEMIEHVADPRPLLKSLRGYVSGYLFASVPNEEVFPFGAGIRYHHRHYTRAQFDALLRECGWEPLEWFGQAGPYSPVEPEVNGRTLVVKARPAAAAVAVAPGSGDVAEARAFVQRAAAKMTEQPKPEKKGLHICIVGLGPSCEAYVDLVKRLGSRQAFCDEVWGINALGDVLACDLIFHMDDVRIQEIRAAANPQSNIARMLEWLKTTRTPVVTSRAHPDYPALQEIPVEAMINALGHAYFNSTAAWAVAYAIFRGATKISCFGLDFTYARAHDAEQGRACVEFWLGYAWARGLDISMPDRTSLMDNCDPQDRRFYGFDTLDLTIIQQPDGSARIDRQPRQKLPTAAEIEAQYDHSRHPNPLVRGAVAQPAPKAA